MVRSVAALSWPECLGSFDEESCRYFLRELGQRVVQYYPFSVGMEEVYTSIVDRYNFSGASDVLSVLQELLEDESTATGAGDDGDIWRSWRHGWKHRNDNPQTPHVPRYRGKPLNPATNQRIRTLKAQNFVAQQTRRPTSRTHPTLHKSQSSIMPLISQNGSRTRYSRPLRSKVSVSNGCAEEYHLALSEQVAGLSVDLSPQRSRLSNASRPFIPCQSSQTGDQEHQSFKDTIVPFSRNGDLGCEPPPQHEQRFQLMADGFEELSAVDSCPIMEDRIHMMTDHRSMLPYEPFPSSMLESLDDKTPISVRIGYHPDNRFSLPSDLGASDVDYTPSKKRAAHRQARMIDGSIFQGKSRKGRAVQEYEVQARSPSKVAEEPASKRDSAASAQDSPRASWMHSVLIRFRGEHRDRKSKQPKLRQQRSSLQNYLSGRSPSNRHHSTLQPFLRTQEMAQSRNKELFGFDGVDDRQRNNKPLPLSPADQTTRPSIQSETQRAFFEHVAQPLYSRSFTPPSSPSLRRTKDKDELRSLVSATMSGPQELTPKEQSLTYSFSPSSSSRGPPSYVTAALFGNQTDSCRPISQSDVYQLETAARARGTSPNASPALVPAPLICYKDAVSIDTWPFQESQTCYEIQDRSQSHHNAPVAHFQQATGSAPSWQDHSDKRGRRPLTPTTMSKAGTRQRDSPPKTSRTRSRSPVKKLIGMVKSMSTNQIPDESNQLDVLTPPGSGVKNRWKELSHKFRHGFLTPDLQQLSQEDMMEQYASEQKCEARDITPPPTRGRLVFPVSIRSSGQSKLWSELEYMLIETCNAFLKEELSENRLSRDSIIRAKRNWQSTNRPQIIEFYYDQATQYDIILANLKTIRLYSDYSRDAVMLNSVLHQWKILIRELAVKTLCIPDSVVRRWLHDGRRVLELLGAPQVTLSNMDKLTNLCLAVISSAEKERKNSFKTSTRQRQDSNHQRSISGGSQNVLIEHDQALDRGSEQPPRTAPISNTYAASQDYSQKSTRHDAYARGQRLPETMPFVFQHGHSKSLNAAQDRGRLLYD